MRKTGNTVRWLVKSLAVLIVLVMASAVTAKAWQLDDGTIEGNTWVYRTEGSIFIPAFELRFTPAPQTDENGDLVFSVGTVVTFNYQSERRFAVNFNEGPSGERRRSAFVENGGRYTVNEPGENAILFFVFSAEAGGYDFGDYLFIMNVVGGTQQPTPRPTPLPTQSIAGFTGELVSTERLVSIVPPAPVAAQELVYVVQPGEQLWTIAFNYYGSMRAGAVNSIFNANYELLRENNNQLEAGMVLVLPARGLRDPIVRASLDGAAGLYLVRRNDTFADLAQHFYGDSSQWRRIRDANQGRLGPGNIIYEGQWIIIPGID